MICPGSHQYFTIFLKNNQAASFAVQPAVAGMNVAYFKNMSTKTMIVVNSSDFGKEVMKSMVTLSHGHSAIGSALETLPVVFSPPYLVGTQDKSSHSTRCHPARVARSKKPRTTPSYIAALDAHSTVCRGFLL